MGRWIEIHTEWGAAQPTGSPIRAARGGPLLVGGLTEVRAFHQSDPGSADRSAEPNNKSHAGLPGMDRRPSVRARARRFFAALRGDGRPARRHTRGGRARRPTRFGPRPRPAPTHSFVAAATFPFPQTAYQIAGAMSCGCFLICVFRRLLAVGFSGGSESVDSCGAARGASKHTRSSAAPSSGDSVGASMRMMVSCARALAPASMRAARAACAVHACCTRTRRDARARKYELQLRRRIVEFLLVGRAAIVTTHLI